MAPDIVGHLADDDLFPAATARRSGISVRFGDVASFHRAFRREFGRTPASVRISRR